jgi:hypothetical protein
VGVGEGGGIAVRDCGSSCKVMPVWVMLMESNRERLLARPERTLPVNVPLLLKEFTRDPKFLPRLKKGTERPWIKTEKQRSRYMIG